mgnify:FL=1|jgi:hypothetical protein|tara:strand:+ start:158 stop:619 length:462 start_codon:yes stop_codon:yes gene_type:complete
MLKKLFIPVLFLFLNSCGYEAIYSKKNFSKFDFSISELTFIGERKVNLKIKQNLHNYTVREKSNSLIVEITSSEEKKTVAKDVAGDPTKFKIFIDVSAKVKKDKIRGNFVFTESFTYNNNSNKMDLTALENNIINNLTRIITEKLIFKLSNFQ